MKSGDSSFSWNIRNVGPSPTSGTPWQQLLQNWFRHVVLSHWLVPYFILNWLSNKLLVDVWPFLVEMMAVTTDGSLLWQTPAYDGEDATCSQRSLSILSLHCLLAISIMWLISVTHALDDQFGGQDYDNACFCFIPDCDGALRGRARAICTCMNVIALVSARIRSGNFDWLSSHLQLLPHALDRKESGGKLGWFRPSIIRCQWDRTNVPLGWAKGLQHLSLEAATGSRFLNRQWFSLWVARRKQPPRCLVSICLWPTLALPAVNVFQ